MPTIRKVYARDLAEQLRAGSIQLVDIREKDEFAREHVKGAISAPLSSISDGGFIKSDLPVVFMCRSGMRTDANCARLSSLIPHEVSVLDGGLDGWKKTGLGIDHDATAPLEINRQVQITAGGLVLIGVALSILVHPGFVGIALFVGAGLVFAGISGWCGMAHLLRVMPWNRYRGPSFT